MRSISRVVFQCSDVVVIELANLLKLCASEVDAEETILESMIEAAFESEGAETVFFFEADFLTDGLMEIGGCEAGRPSLPVLERDVGGVGYRPLDVEIPAAALDLRRAWGK